ncbi:MAG: peptide deformylase [Candidatus Ratteibacteria bacterium]|nr:peptide deformylase [Candidatus Ratteibacteria bacterium]
MAKLPICKYGAPVLRRRCPEVKEITGDIRKILEDMRQTMYEEDGVGLAASQVGEAKRLIVLDGGGGLWQLINPRIISRRDEGASLEGCLSLPGVTVKINRSQEVTVEALNKKGEKIIVEGKGLLSYILQHEIDHLNGILIIDYLDKKKKKKTEEKLKKWIKETPKM